MDPISAIGGAILALLVFGNDNESALPVQTDECRVQIEGSNAFSKTRFAIENPEACGYDPIDFHDNGNDAPRVVEPEDEPEVD